MRRLFLILLTILLLTGCVPTASLPEASLAPPAQPVPAEIPPMVFTHERFSTGETNNPHWYAETTLELLPRDDYGTLYPYPGGLQEYGYWPYSFWQLSAFGLCTADGVIVCDPAFSVCAVYEYNGTVCYALRRDEKVCFLPDDGRCVLAYEDLRDAGEGILAVCRDGKWGAVDFEGNEVLPCVYQIPMRFSEGLAAVTRDFDSGYEYVDTQGNTLFSMPAFATWAQLANYSDGNMELLVNTFLQIISFQEGLAPCLTPEGYYGYVDTQGRAVVPVRYGNPQASYPWFFDVCPFVGGVALVTEGKRIYVIDNTGTERPDLTASDYSALRWPDASPAAQVFREGDTFGYMDADGAVLLPPVYDDIIPAGDRWMVRQGQYVGLVDGAGEWVVRRYTLYYED